MIKKVGTMRKKRVRRRYHYKRIALLLLVVCLLIGGAAYAIFSGYRGSSDKSAVIASDGTREIMIIGVDPREDDVGRSDTMMIATLDEGKKKLSMISVPRDTRVKFEGGYEKINHAYAYGGHELSKKMIESLLDTRIDHYLLVNIESFEKIIDAVGGVDIDVEKRMFYEDPWDLGGGLIIDLQPGSQHLDGKAAMGYVRYRDEEGDIGRIARQQKFVRAFAARAASSEVIPRLPDIAREIFPSVKTDLSIKDLARLSVMLPDVRGNGIDSDTLPGTPLWWGGSSYWLPDIEASRRLLAGKVSVGFEGVAASRAKEAARLYAEELPKGLVDVDGTLMSEEDAIKPADISVRVLNESGITGAAARTAEILRERGFLISEVGNGDVTDGPKTTLTVPDGAGRLFPGLPFPCEIRTGGAAGEAVLRIGRDYEE